MAVNDRDLPTCVGRRLVILLTLQAMTCFAAAIAARTASPQMYSAIEDQHVSSANRTNVSWHRVGWRLLQHDRWKPNPSAAKPLIRSLANAVLTR
jgi:hypothetical protein